ncbi:MAG: hypothetical protein AAFR47_05975 [Pseudomonadota bacterium]
MPRHLAIALLISLALPATAPAQEAGLPTFDSAPDMRAELDRLMEARDFVAVVQRFSPPATMSLGRVRMLEDRLKTSLGPLDNSADLIVTELAPGVTRQVVAYWNGDTYAYVYVLVHARADGLKVLDFQISGDIRQIKEWW